MEKCGKMMEHMGKITEKCWFYGKRMGNLEMFRISLEDGNVDGNR